MARKSVVAAVIGGDDDRGRRAVVPHFVEVRCELADEAIDRPERVEVAAVVVTVGPLVGVAEGDPQELRAMGEQVLDGERFGLAIRAITAISRPWRRSVGFRSTGAHERDLSVFGGDEPDGIPRGDGCDRLARGP